jgi:cysteine synthase
MDTLRRDLVYAIRSLRRSPAFSLARLLLRQGAVVAAIGVAAGVAAALATTRSSAPRRG